MSLLLFFFAFFAADSTVDVSLSEAQILMHRSLKAIDKVQSASYTFTNTERIEGQLLTGEQTIFYQQSPLLVIMEFISPRKGTKIHFEQGQNNDKLVYDPVGFPYTKLYLDPYGDLARDKNHHTIYEVGFQSVGKLLKLLDRQASGRFSLGREEVLYGKKCMSLVYQASDYRIRTYETKPNETTASIAAKFGINEYSIIEKNEQIKEFGKIKAGMKLQLPSSYAKRMIVWLDIETSLPVVQEIYDELGLFEKYAFANTQINVPAPVRILSSKVK